MEIFLSVLWALFKVPVIFCVCVTAVFAMLFLFWYCRLYFSGYRPKGEESRYFVKKRTFFQKLLIDFPRQYAMDVVTRDRQEFPHRGMIIFTGRQGNGKTISMVQAITQCKAEFPECKVLTNFAFSGEDEVLDHWRKLTDFTNGKKGVVVGMDETQNWFSSSQSKNFPPEMLQDYPEPKKPQGNLWHCTEFLSAVKGNSFADDRGPCMSYVVRMPYYCQTERACAGCRWQCLRVAASWNLFLRSLGKTQGKL